MCQRDRGFSLVELLIVLAVVGILVIMVVPQLMTGYDRARQRASMADMRSIAVANATYHTDNNSYAGSFSDLMPAFLNPVPPDDAWGNAWGYSSADGSEYTLTSFGDDGTSGPDAPTPWVAAPFGPDLILTNGAFTQVPEPMH